MNAMTNFTLHSLKANRVRTAVTIAGVALAAALLTAVLTTYFSFTDYLYRSEAANAGTWMAYAEVGDMAASEGDIARATDDPRVTGVATLEDAGFAALTEAQQEKLGTYMPILSVSGGAEDIAGIHPSEGRMPENPGEIMLFATWKDYGDVQLGDTLTLSVGDREAVLVPGEMATASEGSMEAAYGTAYNVDPTTVEIVDGTRLNSSIGYLEATQDGGIFNEQLVNERERTYTVVGFYNRLGYTLSTGVGTAGVTVDEPETDGFGEVFLTMAGMENSDQVLACAEELFPNDHVVLHSAMLRYMGVTSDSSIWSTFFGIVAVLAMVIAGACVSLIFNAFNISVAERISQFGLLSSVGASRRQLRRAVVLEGCVVALIGIPLGLVVGLAGCAVTFALLGPAISNLAGNAAVEFYVAPNGTALVAAAALTLVTVLVSVWIPAKRASRVNVIDALRNAGAQRVSKKGAKAAAKAARTGTLWKTGGVVDRLFGVGGKLARINRKRGTAKGRAASVSLALAIVLLMTAGSLNVFLGSLVGVASGGEAPGEVSVTAEFSTERDSQPSDLSHSEGDSQPSGSEDGGSGESADPAGEKGDRSDGRLSHAEPVTAASVLAGLNERFASEAAEFSKAYDYLAESSGAQGIGWLLRSDAAMALPESMVGDAFRIEGGIDGGLMADGRYGTTGSVLYLDDEAFDAYAQSLGLNPVDFRDGEHPRAIALAQGYGNNGNVYQLLDILREPGTIEVVAAAAYEGRPAHVAVSFDVDASTEMTCKFQPYVRDENDATDVNESLTLDDVELATVPVEVAAVTDKVPALLGGPGSGVMLIVPESLAATQSLGGEAPIFTSYFDSADDDHEALAEELATRGGEFFHDGPYEMAFYSYNDLVAQTDATQQLAMVVNVFCLLFTVILALIAMANVFNTVTNSLILRRREFAVMKSVGLSNRQFRRMIMDECASFGVAGLVPGLLVSLAVSWLLYSAVTQSMSGLPFQLPWAYVGMALVMTAAAMGISVAYGMHRCKADNVVEALRADSV
ncbi:ABC transporter permease [uncultured Adlercreutzia sp.]|uniref:ABC transporter permease n=1 Tax=uncultured Adlercreutzia sp. TaxID=875803 RepID=UPI0026F38502|nr:ABC transporter permease [uncultured Adlercreutzia sp.]